MPQKHIDISKLHVITMISNPLRFHSRYRLYRKFREHLKRAGIKLWTAEVAFGDRPFEVTTRGDKYDLQLRTDTELWHKERALNLLIGNLTAIHPDWQYVVWVDADIEFPKWHGPDAWFIETVHALQHHQVVQCFQHAIDMGPHGEHIHTHTGFAYSYVSGMHYKPGYCNWHPGFVWGARREAIEAEPLIDWGILGSGDRHMAMGWVGKIEDSLNKACQTPYLSKLKAWQEQTERYVRRDVGYVPGLILHHWHGKKKDRHYADRWKILVETQFDPDRDIKPDAQGLWQLADHGDLRSIVLRDRLRQYFRSRHEDSIDLE